MVSSKEYEAVSASFAISTSFKEISSFNSRTLATSSAALFVLSTNSLEYLEAMAIASLDHV